MSRTTTLPGLLLAAGAGRRAGGPKALHPDRCGTPWVVTSARTLLAGGCAPVVVAVGCRQQQVRAALAGEDVDICPVPRWRTGLAASLRAGLTAAFQTLPTAVLVHLVDLPDVGPAVVRRVLSAGPVEPTSLRRAGYGDRPGHPVLIGSAHREAVLSTVRGDTGAGAYLGRAGVRIVPCADLAAGADVDRPVREDGAPCGPG